MDEQNWATEQFAANRDHLRGVAYKMLGSLSEADDAVQEAWLHMSRADTSDIRNMGGWLTTIVARVCLDMLRSRNSRREEPLAEYVPHPNALREAGTDPEHEALLADSVGLALLVVLDTLNPAERLAFVLHDVFDVPFDEIAPIVGRTPESARQLASRARRRVRGASTVPDANLSGQRKIVDAFLAASRSGDFDGLLAVLDPDVVLRADTVVVKAATSRQERGAPKLAPQIQGAAAVADTFAGRAGVAQPAFVDGAVGAVWAPDGQPRAVFAFRIADGKIVEINLVADPKRIREFDIVLISD